MCASQKVAVHCAVAPFRYGSIATGFGALPCCPLYLEVFFHTFLKIEIMD